MPLYFFLVPFTRIRPYDTLNYKGAKFYFKGLVEFVKKKGLNFFFFFKFRPYRQFNLSDLNFNSLDVATIGIILESKIFLIFKIPQSKLIIHLGYQ